MIKAIIILVLLIGLLDYALIVASSTADKDAHEAYERWKEKTQGDRPMIGDEVIAVYVDDGDGYELQEVQRLVRCKECKRTKDYFKQHTDRLVWCEKWKCAMNTNGYCSYGERKAHE